MREGFSNKEVETTNSHQNRKHDARVDRRKAVFCLMPFPCSSSPSSPFPFLLSPNPSCPSGLAPRPALLLAGCHALTLAPVLCVKRRKSRLVYTSLTSSALLLAYDSWRRRLIGCLAGGNFCFSALFGILRKCLTMKYGN